MKSRPNPFLRSAALAASIVLTFAAPAQAGSLTWDGSDTSTSGAQGGTGNWNQNTPTIPANWWDGLAGVVWPNTGTDNDAIFGGTSGTVTIDAGGVTVNDMLFNTTGYILSGTGTITLNGTTPSITLGSGISGTISSVLAGSAGLTKAGAGTLLLNSTSANTFTGGLNINGGILVLDFANLTTPTNLINSGNALTLGGSTLSVTGKSTGATSQTFTATVLNSGAATITLAQNGGTSTTLQLGAITRNVGATLNFSNVPGTSGIIAKRGTSATAGLLGGWATVGTGTSMTYAAIDASANIVTSTTTTSTTSNTSLITGQGTGTWSTDGTKSYQTSGLGALTAARSINLYRSINTTPTTFSLGDTSGANFSVNGFMNTGTGVITIQRGTAANYVLVGSALDLVFTGPTGITVSAPIANNGSTAGAGGSASALTYSGTGTGINAFTLSGTNLYTGQTTVNSGTMVIGTNGSINSSSGIVVNGGTFVQANTATAVSPALSLTNGTVDGTGTINTVNVSDSTTAKITNGNGGTGALTIGNLTFNGDGAIDIRTAGSAGLTVTGTLATTAANGQVIINVVAAPAWSNGNTYNLIGYGTLTGSIGDFTKGNITGLGARQTATLGNAGGFITLGIAGDSALWTGTASGAWTTNTIGTPFNWKTLAGNADTQFLTNDDVVFNDTATSTSVDITTANVSTNSVIFDNTTKSYTISSSGGYGIASGTVTKNGGNTVSLTTANTYNGSTTINAGILHVSGSILNSSAIQINGGLLQASGGNALSNTGVLTLANTAGATFQVLGSETIGALAGGGTTGGSVVIDNGQILSLGSGTQTFGGVISGQGGLTVSGAIQTLTGTNTYQGATLISSGMLEIGNGVTDGSIATTSSITTNGTLRLNLAADQNYSVGIDGTGGITKTGAGALTLSGTNNYSGTTSITTGTVKAGSTTALGTNSAVTLANTAGVTLDLNGNALTIGSLAGGGSTGGTVALGASTLKLNMATNTTFTGAFTGAGTLELNATGAANSTFTYTGASSSAAFTGTVDVKKGILLFGSVHNALGTTVDGAKVIIADGAQAKADWSFNASYANQQTFVINGTGTDGYGALQILGLRYGGGASIGGLAVASNALFTTTGYLGAIPTTIAGLAGTGTLTLSGKVSGTTTNLGSFTIATAVKSLAGYSAFNGNLNLRSSVTLNSKIADALGSAAGGYGNVDLEDGTKLNIEASQTIGGLSDTTSTLFTGAVALGDKTLTIGHSTTNLSSTFGGVISGTGGIAKAGSGLLKLAGVNIYSGITSVQNGNLQLTGSLSTSTTLNLGDASNNSGKFILGSSTSFLNQSVAGLSITGTGLNNAIVGGNSSVSRLTVTNTAGTSVFSGKLGGSLTNENNLALTKSGAGALTLSGDNTFTGGVTLQGDTAATLNINSATALGTGTFTINSGDSAKIDATATFGVANTLTSNNAQTWNNNFAFVGTNDLNMGTGAVTLSGSRQVTVTAKNLTIGGVIDDGVNSYSLTKLGGGTLTLAGANTYNGATAVNAGILAIAHEDALDNTSSITVGLNNASTTSLRIDVLDATSTTTGFGKSVTIRGNGSGNLGALLGANSSSVTWAGDVVLADTTGARIGGGTSGTLTVDGVISETNAGSAVLFSRAAGSTTILNKVNTYTGDTGMYANGSTVTLKMGIANAISSSSRVWASTGTATGTEYFDLNGFNQNIRALRDDQNADLVVTNGSLTNDAELKLSMTSAESFNGWIQDGAIRKTSLVLTGTGSQNFSGVNTYTGGTSIQAGSLILTGGNDRLATTGSVSLGDVSTNGKLILGDATAARNQTLAGLTSTGLGGNVVGAHATTDSLLTLNIASGTNTFGGVLGGTGTNENHLALTKSGNGTLELTGTNTYNGDTTITTGTLALTGTGSIANSANLIVNSTLDVSGITAGTFSVGSGQKLSGDGTLTATGKTLSIEGTHAVGNSPGQQDITGNVSYASTSIFEWDLAANADTDGYDDDANPITPNTNVGARGTDFDAVDITGTLAIDSAAVFKVIQNAGVTFSNPFWAQNQEWSNIFTYTGSTPTGWSNTAVSVYNTSNILQDVSVYGAFTITGTTLTWSAVPEPTSALVGLLIGAGLLRRRRQS